MPDSATEPSTARVTPFSPYVGLRHLVRSQPLMVGPSTSVRETLQLLDKTHGDAVVVVDEGSRVALGIITLHDVVRRVAIEACDLTAPIAAVMTGGLITVPADSTAHQASVVMVRRGVHHLVLTEADGSYFNLVSQTDLYTLPGAQGTDLVKAILAARDLPTLVHLAAEIRALVGRLVAERVSADALCNRLSSLNDLLTLQVIELVAGKQRAALRPMVLAGFWFRGAARADPGYRPGQWPDLRRRLGRAGGASAQRFPAFRPGGERGPRRLWFSAMQGRYHGQ
jgi:signal-transduction protein with cAMP-binding, CBS, and nucleotidyltransferase domain